MRTSKTVYIPSVILLTITIIFHVNLMGQSRTTLSGAISDAQTGESLIGATVQLLSQEIGAAANGYGFYSISIPPLDSITVVYSYLGYASTIKRIAFSTDIKLDVQLSRAEVTLGEAVVRGNRSSDNIDRTQMGVIDIPVSKILSIPAIFGESDVLKVIQLLPGVQSGNEGTTGFFVRGGNADQNLVQLDEAVVYNPNHLFGLFSTFNTRALNNVELIKGGFPAQYGGRLSSILDIKMKEGNLHEHHVHAGIGLITSQLTVEGPIAKNKASFIFSGRTTYLNLLLKGFQPKGTDTNYGFQDFNAKVNWKIGESDRIFLSGFLGKDDARYKETKGLHYRIHFGNSAITMRWNHLYNKKLFSNVSLIHNTYLQNVSTIQDSYYSQTYSGIRDLTAKVGYQYFATPAHTISFGGLFTNHALLATGKSETLPLGGQVPFISTAEIPSTHFSEYALYIADEFKVSNRLSLNYGLRMPGFHSAKSNYLKLEPRLTAKINLNSTSSVKASYTVMNQFLHLIPSSTAALPTDIWIPSSDKTKPQHSKQFAVGYFKNFAENNYETSVEVYYKEMADQVLFGEGNQLVFADDIDNGLVYGRGLSYGVEFFLRKNTGRLNGWVSYTLSKTDQQFSDLNYARSFPFKYDRRHALSVVTSFALNDKWDLSAVFVYASGAAYTVPTGRIIVSEGPTIFEGSYFLYEGRNNTRLRATHRLDISASRKKTGKMFKRNIESEWVFGLYNAYSRQNPYFVYFQIDHLENRPIAKQVSLLPILPSVSYNIKF